MFHKRRWLFLFLHQPNHLTIYSLLLNVLLHCHSEGDNVVDLFSDGNGKQSHIYYYAEESQQHKMIMTKEVIETLLKNEGTNVVISSQDFKEILEMFYQKKQDEDDETKYLTRQEASVFLNCDLATLWKMEQKQTLIPTRLGRRVYYKNRIWYNV